MDDCYSRNLKAKTDRDTVMRAMQGHMDMDWKDYVFKFSAAKSVQALDTIMEDEIKKVLLV